MHKLAFVCGDGEFKLPVVGESRHQDVLEDICGGKSRRGAQHRCMAVLVPEPDNPHDPGAVAVLIDNQEVGYLARDAAPHFIKALRPTGAPGAHCQAMVVGGWHRDEEEEDGFFGVKLDATAPFEIDAPRNHRLPIGSLLIVGALAIGATVIVLKQETRGSSAPLPNTTATPQVLQGAWSPATYTASAPTPPAPRAKAAPSTLGALKVDAGDRNEANRRLMALGEADRRTLFQVTLSMSHEKCTEVTRTFYKGSSKPTWNAIWNVECRGGPSYVVQINSDETGSTKVLTCGQLRAMTGSECFSRE